jgi:hypothetical protein
VHGNPYTRKPISAFASIPDASQTASVTNAPSLSWVERLQALSAQTGVPILADYYRCQSPPLPTVDPFPVENGYPARLALDQMGKAQSALWWVQGKTLLLRRRNWYTQRLYEVPDRWVLQLQKHLATQKGNPTYGDVFKLMELTQAQMAGLRVADVPNGSIGILGEGTNETSVIGLPELLAIYKAQYASIARTPVPDLPTNEADTRRATLTYNELPVGLRSLVAAFIQAQRNPGLLAESGEPFFTRLTRNSLQTGQMSYAHLALTWTEGNYALSLPTILVDDHRDKTEVEIIP